MPKKKLAMLNMFMCHWTPKIVEVKISKWLVPNTKTRKSPIKSKQFNLHAVTSSSTKCTQQNDGIRGGCGDPTIKWEEFKANTVYWEFNVHIWAQGFQIFQICHKAYLKAQTRN